MTGGDDEAAVLFEAADQQALPDGSVLAGKYLQPSRGVPQLTIARRIGEADVWRSTIGNFAFNYKSAENGPHGVDFKSMVCWEIGAFVLAGSKGILMLDLGSGRVMGRQDTELVDVGSLTICDILYCPMKAVVGIFNKDVVCLEPNGSLRWVWRPTGLVKEVESLTVEALNLKEYDTADVRCPLQRKRVSMATGQAVDLGETGK